jgi:hypothetical protein
MKNHTCVCRNIYNTARATHSRYYNYFVKYACDFSLILLEPCNFQYYSTTPSITPPPLLLSSIGVVAGGPCPRKIETRRKIVHIVGIFVVKHTCIYAGPPSASSEQVLREQL